MYVTRQGEMYVWWCWWFAVNNSTTVGDMTIKVKNKIYYKLSEGTVQSAVTIVNKVTYFFEKFETLFLCVCHHTCYILHPTQLHKF